MSDREASPEDGREEEQYHQRSEEEEEDEEAEEEKAGGGGGGSRDGSAPPAANEEEEDGGGDRSHHRRGSRESRSRSRSYSRSYSSRRRHSYSRSRSRSRSSRRKHRHYSRSHSRSPRRSSRHYYYGSSRSRRTHSRSPMSNRRRHVGSRDNPTTSRCLGVFGLSLYTQERDLKEVFSKYGPIEDVQVVYDAQSGRSRGFSFVYFENVDDAKAAKDRCNGIEIDGRKIRVDYSITQRAHTPTPGIYMGKPSYSSNKGGGYGGGGYRGGYRDRSPSPYYRRRYSRSRSRSYSPRSLTRAWKTENCEEKGS
ncbi:transformer-2 protein homolog alpha-like [Ornithodoros turicata]|uniref:transformer-2 protein homolog alpha-like n=1 Tax=Ornithodoros turicata TaxID=34597 RepID=UPI0031398B7F